MATPPASEPLIPLLYWIQRVERFVPCHSRNGILMLIIPFKNRETHEVISDADAVASLRDHVSPEANIE